MLRLNCKFYLVSSVGWMHFLDILNFLNNRNNILILLCLNHLIALIKNYILNHNFLTYWCSITKQKL